MTRKTRRIRVEGNIAYVPLTRGLEAIIDAADVPLVEGRNWHAMVWNRSDGSIGTAYAVRNETCDDGTRHTVLLHRVIAGTPDDLDTDHRDGNGLHNWRANLRVATRAQNNHNQRPSINNTSGFKGVTWDAARGKWQAQIVLNGKKHNLGRFTTPEAAAEAYAKGSRDLHGAFGRSV
jgi:hypothetical protein